MSSDTMWVIGNGQNIDFWSHRRTSQTLVLAVQIPSHFQVNLKAKVAYFIHLGH